MKTIREAGALAARAGTRRAGLRPADYLFRSAVVHLKAGSRDIGAVAKQIYPDDMITPQLLQRAASAPATIANQPWAGAVVREVVSDLLQAIVSISAAASLLVRAQQIVFNRQLVILPSRLVDAAYAGSWTAEGEAIPVYQFFSSGVTLQPHRLNVISVFTNEMIAASNIEDFVRSLLSESAALALDAALFGSQADNGVIPGGILSGLTPITASAVGSTSRRDCMIEDLQNLVQTLADNGGGADACFVCAPGQAVAARMNVPSDFDHAILGSAALPSGTVVCIEPRSLVATIVGVEPEFSTAESALLHMETAPADIVNAGTPSAPTKSLFQLDSVALKMTLKNIDWKMRAPHCAYVQDVNW
jgi:hypothetical protein